MRYLFHNIHGWSVVACGFTGAVMIGVGGQGQCLAGQGLWSGEMGAAMQGWYYL